MIGVEEILTRRCSICKSEKNLDLFYRHKNRPLGRGMECKKCWAASRAEYRKNNHDLIRKRWRSRYAEQPEQFRYSTIKARCKAKGLPFSMTRQEFYAWYKEQPKHCEYCGLIDLSLDLIAITRRPLAMLSIDRKDNSKTYTPDNMCLCCWTCNFYKGSLFSHDEFKEIAQKYIRPKWMAKAEAAVDKAA